MSDIIKKAFENIDPEAEKRLDEKLKNGSELFGLYDVSGSFESKCSVKVAKTGENCPEKPTKEINEKLVCDKCYENWKHLENNDR